MNTKSIVERPSRIRSAITNSPFKLRGIDGRSAESRRWRDLVIAYANDVGGVEALSESQRALVTQAATVQLSAEKIQARIVAGEVVDGEELTRLSNVLARLLAAIGARKGNGKSDGSTALQDYLAARAAEQDADADHEAVETDVEVDLEFNKRHPFESAPASAHVAPDPDFAPAEPIEADAQAHVAGEIDP
jgi:predicted ATPase with chaperone activity